jgi:hypothetical protein
MKPSTVESFKKQVKPKRISKPQKKIKPKKEDKMPEKKPIKSKKEKKISIKRIKSNSNRKEPEIIKHPKEKIEKKKSILKKNTKISNKNPKPYIVKELKITTKSQSESSRSLTITDNSLNSIIKASKKTTISIKRASTNKTDKMVESTSYSKTGSDEILSGSFKKTDGPIYDTISTNEKTPSTLNELISHAQIYTERKKETDEVYTDNINDLIADNITIFKQLLEPKLVNMPKRPNNIFFKKRITLKRISRFFTKFSYNSKINNENKSSKKSKYLKKFRKAVNAIIFLKRYGTKIMVRIAFYLIGS